jgi:sugar phosphate permease
MVIESGWRKAWWIVGLALMFGLAPLSWLLVRNTPESCGLQPDADDSKTIEAGETDFSLAKGQAGMPVPLLSFTLRQALLTPAFWVFGIAGAVYGLVASGIALFNESILAERGFDASTYHRSLVIVALTSLVGNFLGGWLISRGQMNRLLAVAMILLAGSLFGLPHVSTQTHVAAYAVVMGLAGGFVIVIFFAVWSRAYGRAHLGKIQGAAQALTVIASAIGPLLLAESVARTGSYATMFYALTVVVLLLALSAWFVKLPSQEPGGRSRRQDNDPM